jgi:ferredoxin
MDLLTILRRTSRVRYRNLSDKLNKSLHYLRYVLVLFFLIVPFIFWAIEPLPNLDFAIVMATRFAGPFIHLSILLGPVVPLTVPWKGELIVGDLNFSYPYLQEVYRYAGENFALIASLIFLSLTLIGSFLIRRAWCRFCPTGASLGVVNRFKGFKWAPLIHLDKDETKCTKCGICKRVCPLQVTEVYEQKGGNITTSMCMLCLRCVEMCPYENCLKVNMAKKTLFRSRNWLEPSQNE